jgi:sporulation protein YlmC with PRC-barrel domain
MRLSELLSNPVVDERGERLGVVADVQLQRDEGYWTVTGIRVAHRHARSLFGYEREDAGGPAPVRWLVRRLHRGDRFVPWSDVRYVSDREVRVRIGEPQAP